jgi:hypothetical protein
MRKEVAKEVKEKDPPRTKPARGAPAKKEKHKEVQDVEEVKETESGDVRVGTHGRRREE